MIEQAKVSGVDEDTNGAVNQIGVAVFEAVFHKSCRVVYATLGLSFAVLIG
jgi:hypothetical protein